MYALQYIHSKQIAMHFNLLKELTMNESTNVTITATKAKQLADNSANKYVNEAFRLIKEAAENGEYSVEIRNNLWSGDSILSTPRYVKGITMLRDAGFTVEQFHIENTVIDNGIRISW